VIAGHPSAPSAWRRERVTAMQRARRSALLLTLALLGAATLTGCRSEPGVAIYVGGARHTQHEVDDLATKLAGLSGDLREGRTQVVQWMVLRDVIKRTAIAEKWDAPQVDVDAASSSLQASVQQGAEQAAQKALGDNPSADQISKAQAEITDKVAAQMRTIRPVSVLFAEVQAYMKLAQAHVSSETPPDADYTDLYHRAKEAGFVKPGASETDFRQGLSPQDRQAVESSFRLRDLLAGMVKRADLTINPRYAPANVSMLNDGKGHDLIVLQLDSKAGAPVRAVVPSAPAPEPEPVA
jgi:hypothetical protein